MSNSSSFEQQNSEDFTNLFKMAIYLENTCRCCLLSNKEQVLVMSEHQIHDENGESPLGSNILDSYFEMCVDPTRATLGLFKICSNCRQTLETCIRFRKQCQRSNEQFQKNWIKKESEQNVANIIYNDRHISNKYSVSEVLIAEVKTELDIECDIINSEQTATKAQRENRRISSPSPDENQKMEIEESVSDGGGEGFDYQNDDNDDDEGHQCQKCYQNFATAKLLWDHIKLTHYARHTLVPPDCYMCRECGLEFKRVKQLDAHLHRLHPDKTQFYPCFYCKKTNWNLDFLLRRCKVHCKRRLQAAYRLKQPEPAKICCDCCDLKFHVEDELDCHKIIVRNQLKEFQKIELEKAKGAETPQSTRRNKSTLQVEQRNLQIASLHDNPAQLKKRRLSLARQDENQDDGGGETTENIDSDSESHQCMNCKQKFATEFLLWQHVTYTHYARTTRKASDTYMCRDCGLEFTKVKDLDEHVHLWHPDKIIFFPCFYCKRTNWDIKCLRRLCKGNCTKKRNEWKRLHPEPAKICCDCCNLKFHEEDELDCHKITVRNQTNEFYKANKKEIEETTADKEAQHCNDSVSKGQPRLELDEEGELDCQKIHKQANDEPKKEETKTDHRAEAVQDLSDSDHECLKCHQNFDTSELLKQHILSAHINPRTKKQAYSCRDCGMNFEKVIELDNHVHNLHPDKTIYFPCFYCKKTSSVLKNLRKMCRNKCEARQKTAYNPNKPAPTISCDCCNQKFHEADELDCHRIAFRSREAELNERFYCEICNVRFLMRSDFIQHMKGIHKQRKVRMKPDVMCSVCGKIVESVARLRLHAITHSNVRDFKCDVCPAAFKTQQHLDKHKEGHTRVKKFQCNECGRLFGKLPDLRKHLLRLHFPEVRQFSCAICHKGLTTFTEKLRHEKTHLGERRFVCNVCDKSYTTEGGLQSHIQVRHTTMRYECKFCDKKLATKQSIWKHVFVHRGYYPFNCPVCNYGCYPKELMQRHLKTKHQMQYDEKLHGYNKETCNEVVASGIRIDEQNVSNFRSGRVTMNWDYDFLNRKVQQHQTEIGVPQQDTTENPVTVFESNLNF